ncbi:MAG: Unknown protein [uncultured Thiotrichaceae bacterium]|uniref:DNA-binding response regulator n=1 Tax=uncultured Thiotrichaceae bacterium TaxID=298394 RepID=A0A6S6UGQ6_9GAMM|nr:MAG: Unknown protein [uncultured Thiotrichaceae bacterium]
MLEKKIKNRILIVDDDDILQVFLQKCLLNHNYKTFCLSNGEGIPDALEKNHIDLIVLDVLLPGKDGGYWLKWIKQYHPQIPVIMASVLTNENERLRGLQNGAIDYLIKPFHDQELLIRIKNVLRRSTFGTVQTTLKIGSLHIDTKNNNVDKNGDIFPLTQMETNILKLFYLNPGTVLSRDEIMEQVKGVKHNPLDRSIDIHINKIRKKIEEDPANPIYIRTIRGKGYCLQLHNQ